MQERGCRYQWSLDPAAAAHIHTEYVPSSLSTLALPPLSTRSYLSPPSPDFDPANTLPPALSSRIENFLPSSLFLISLLVISSRF